MRFPLVTVAVLASAPAWAGVNGLPEAVHESAIIARVHVDKIEKIPGRFAQRSTVSVTDGLRGAGEKTLTVLSADQGFSGVELKLVDGADQIVFLRKETVDGNDAWVVLEAFLVNKQGLVMLGDGSTTWWVMRPLPVAEARAQLVKAISDDNKLPRGPLQPAKSGPRKDPG